MIEGRRLRLLSLAATLGTPSYVYFLDEIRASANRIRDAFGNAFEVSYAVKANPAHGLLVAMRDIADALDVSSGGEIERAVAAGWEPSKISFTGPAKRETELTTAIGTRIGEVILESPEEARQLSAMCRAAGVRQRVLVRIAASRVPPGFGDTMSGKPCAFGIDEEDLPTFLDLLKDCAGLDLIGFHAYSGTQCLRAASIVENWRIFADLFASASRHAGIEPERLVFGAGFGIRYHDGQEQLDLAEVASGAATTISGLRSAFPRARLVLETGRYIVGEAGVLLTRVQRVKHSRGVRIGVCDSGLNHHLAAAGLFGMLMRRNFRMANVSVPPGSASDGAAFQLSGPLCTSIDVLARNAAFPRLEAADVIAIESSGAYGPTASPSGFITHPPAREWLVDGDEVRSASDGRPD